MVKNKILQSEIRNMFLECNKVNGINLSQGVCDIGVHKIIKKATKKAIFKNKNSYSKYDGIEELKIEIQKKLFSYNNIYYDLNEIVVTSGSTAAFYCACLALLKPGDEVIVFEPFYGYHVNTLRAIGIKPVFVEMVYVFEKWQFSSIDLERVITKKTKAIVICTPNNPTGKVFDIEELKDINDFCNKYNLIVFSDEIYEYFVYDNNRHISPAFLENLRERTVTISGFSKIFSITGWRIGYCACKKDWANTIGLLHDLIYVCAPTPLQYGVKEGLEYLNENFYLNLKRKYEKIRNAFCIKLYYTKKIIPYNTQGAYYIFADLFDIEGKNSKEKAMTLLNNYKIACVPGSAFYNKKNNTSLVRFCFAKTEKEMKQVYKILQKI